jgi:hypothetical protein
MSDQINPVIVTTEADLKRIIENFLPKIIEDAFEKIKGDELQEKLLSPEEACKLFVPAISIATLNNYSNRGLVKKHYLGRLTFYKYSELIEALTTIRRYERAA